MKFLVDRCAGSRLADWLRAQGHDVMPLPPGRDPGDEQLLALALRENCVLISIDMDFGKLIYHRAQPHCGLVRLPDVPVARRVELMAQVLERHGKALEAGAVVTVRGNRIRVSHPSKR